MRGLLAFAGSIVFGFHVGWGQMDIAGGGVDVSMAQQFSHDSQIAPASARALPKV
ncbi:MAG: hypothetical protein M3021_10275 [Actinomycetota bacterium]|nr:hypothetical protein [Actinomycetota bacterium]